MRAHTLRIFTRFWHALLQPTAIGSMHRLLPDTILQQHPDNLIGREESISSCRQDPPRSKASSGVPASPRCTLLANEIFPSGKFEAPPGKTGAATRRMVMSDHPTPAALATFLAVQLAPGGVPPALWHQPAAARCTAAALRAAPPHLPKRAPAFWDTAPGRAASASHRPNGVTRVMSAGGPAAAPGSLEKRPTKTSTATRLRLPALDLGAAEGFPDSWPSHVLKVTFCVLRSAFCSHQSWGKHEADSAGHLGREMLLPTSSHSNELINC